MLKKYMIFSVLLLSSFSLSLQAVVEDPDNEIGMPVSEILPKVKTIKPVSGVPAFTRNPNWTSGKGARVFNRTQGAAPLARTGSTPTHPTTIVSMKSFEQGYQQGYEVGYQKGRANQQRQIENAIIHLAETLPSGLIFPDKGPVIINRFNKGNNTQESPISDLPSSHYSYIPTHESVAE